MMTDPVAAADPPASPEAATTGPEGRAVNALPGALPTAAVVALVALVVSPILIGAASLVGQTWFPLSDWSSAVLRTSQVGTGDTPLVGAYSVHGFAHPGPLAFWLAAPLYRLTGGNPVSLLWTGALVNGLAIAALGAVTWRRGRWPLLLAAMLAVALLVRGLGPERAVDIWNPYVAVLPFTLAVFLVWDAALGRRRAALEAVVPASFAAQCHLAFVPLTVLLAAWLVAWAVWERRRARELDPESTAGKQDGSAAAPWVAWRGTVRMALVVAGVLWVGPLLDALFDLHNPIDIVRSSATRPVPRVGLFDAVGLVGRYVRPDGPWMGGAEPTDFIASLRGSGPLPLVVALGATAVCLRVGRRRGLLDVTALATLSLTLTLGALPAASQVVVPNLSYLTEWLKVVGVLVWFTVGWTVWRVVEPSLAGAGRTARRRAVGLATVAAVGVAAAGTWGDAASLTPPFGDDAELVAELRAELDEGLAEDGSYRVDVAGDGLNHFRGVIYWMIEDGFDVRTSDGVGGLKWGRTHRWLAGDHADAVLTLAVQYPGALSAAFVSCLENGSARLVADHDGLTASERTWLEDLHLRRLTDPTSISESEGRRAAGLEADDLRIGVFEGPRACARDPKRESTGSSGGSSLAFLLAGGGLAAAAVAFGAVRRRR